MKTSFFKLLIFAFFFMFGFISCTNNEKEDNSLSGIIDALNARSELSDFAAAFNKLDLSGVKASELIVFAVPNGAFSKNSSSKSSGEALCDDMSIYRHIVEGKYAQMELTDSLELMSLDSTILLVAIVQGHTYINGVELAEIIHAGENAIFVVGGAIPCTAAEEPEKPYIPVSGITLSDTELSIVKGKTGNIQVYLQPGNATNQIITWQIEKPELLDVTSVTDSLLVSITALAEGVSKITFTSAEGDYTAVCFVTATAAETVEFSFMDYSLAGTSCHWKNFKSDEVIVINSYDVLNDYIMCTDGNYPEIDFSKNSLLLARGATSSIVGSVKKNLQQISVNEYILFVDFTIDLKSSAVGWTIILKTTKIPQNVFVKLLQNQLL